MQATKMSVILICCFLSLMCVTGAPSPEEPLFELPVQLVGFPVIIAAVRVSNFVKKLAYSLNPETYRSRSKRDLLRLLEKGRFDIDQIEKHIQEEFGQSACIFENVCLKYAKLKFNKNRKPYSSDWKVVFRRLKESSNIMNENYLLSALLGDIIGSPELCHKLAKQKKLCVKGIL